MDLPCHIPCKQMGFHIIFHVIHDHIYHGFIRIRSPPAMWGPRSIAKLVHITPISLCFMVLVTIVTGANLNQGHIEWFEILSPSSHGRSSKTGPQRNTGGSRSSRWENERGMNGAMATEKLNFGPFVVQKNVGKSAKPFVFQWWLTMINYHH